jgi:hypothetical protein
MRRSAKIFRYTNVWWSHADYGKVVSELWEGARHGNGLAGLISLLKDMLEGLEQWGSDTFGNFKKRLANL